MNELKEISKTRIKSAWVVAAAADFLQIVAFPFFWQGALSPVDDALDLVVGGALTALIGWHWSFVPSFIAKLVPALDLVPTWSAAVLIATRKTVAVSHAGTGPGAGPSSKVLAGGETEAARVEREAAARHGVAQHP